jgi:predicted amidohydrolase YtcJ
VGWWVTREYQGKVWSPDEKIDRVTALKGWTVYAAEDLLRGKELGSLEAGKLADFAVIDKDYFTVPEKDLMTINTLMTGINGKVAFKSPKF